MNKGRVAVVGAGISGLACAYELQKAGHDVVVYEKEAVPGGRSGTRRPSRYPFDIGAQFFNNGYEHTRHYCKELGIAAHWRTMTLSTHHLFCDDQLYNVSYSSVHEFLRMAMYSPLSRLRLLLCYLRLRRDSKSVNLYEMGGREHATDAISAKEFILKWGGPDVLEFAFDSMIHTYHFHGSEDLSLTCLLGAIGAIGEGFSYDYLEQGFDELPRALAKKLNIRFACSVQAVRSAPDGVIVEAASQHERYDYAVVATTPSVAKSILHTPSPQQKQLLGAVNYASTVVASFKVPAASISHLAMVAVPGSQNPHICCYINQASKYAAYEEEGDTLVNVMLRDSSAKQVLQWTDEELWKLFEREFLKVCPPLQVVNNQVRRYDLQRWPEAIPKYSSSYLPLATAFLRKGQGNSRVFLCGDYLNSPWVEGSIRCGQQISRDVHASMVQHSFSQAEMN